MVYRVFKGFSDSLTVTGGGWGVPIINV